MSNNGIPPLNDWQSDNYPVIYDESAEASYYVKSGNKIEIPRGSSYLVASVTLTDAQIKALPTTGIEVVAAPGENKAILVMNGLIQSNFSVAYDTEAIDDVLRIRYDGLASVYAIPNDTNTLALDNFLTQSSSGWWPISPYINTYVDTVDWKISPVGSLAIPTNKSIKIDASVAGGNFTGGNAANTLKITLYYIVVDL